MNFLISIFMQLIFINIIDDAVAMHDGKNIEEGNFKFMVHIHSFVGDEYCISCGGVVIDQFHIMTAAHCVTCSEAEEISIFMGSVSVPASFFFHAVDEVYIHPNYTSMKNCSASEKPFTQDKSFRGLCLNFLTSCIPQSASKPRLVAAANDIAILKLYIPTPLGDAVTNVNLPDSESLPYCERLNIASWYDPNTSSEPIPLQFTEVELIFPEDCDFRPPDDQFCASTMDRATRFGMVHRPIPLGDIITNANLPDSDVLPYCDGLHVASWHITEGRSWSVTLQSTGIRLIDDNDCDVPILSENFCANTVDLVERFGSKYVSEGSTVRDCVENCVEKEVWSTRTYCCQNDGCNKAGPSLHAAITTLWMTSIALGIVAAGRLGG